MSDSPSKGPELRDRRVVIDVHRFRGAVELRDIEDTYLVVARNDVSAAERDLVMPAYVASWAFENLHGRLDPSARADLLRMFGVDSSARLDDNEAHARIGEAIREEHVVFLRLPRPERQVHPQPNESPVPATFFKRPRLAKTTWFSLTVLDEVGRGLGGLEVELNVGGDPLVVSTNGAGNVRLDDLEGVSTVGARIVSLDALRTALKPRWKKARAPKIRTGANVMVCGVEGATQTVPLAAATEQTLVITPHFECHKIDGAHFEFGRSFVRGSALEPLAAIAEALNGDLLLEAMIFGHTDLAGSDKRNKELSERRAHALFALFTHDAEAWEALFTGTADGPNWREKWDLEEVQHMLNALRVTDDAGGPLLEDGIRGPSTIQAIHRFQAGHYPDCPAEQAPLPASTTLGTAGRKELFLAYAKRVSRTPVDAAQFSDIGGAKFMGCGEYNPLSASAKDAESRRAVIFVMNPAAGPAALPCQLRSIGPCTGKLTAPPAGGSAGPPYRCSVYREAAAHCPCRGGLDLSHDLILRFAISLELAANMPNTYVLDSDDGTIHLKRSLASDGRANADGRVELGFLGLPETHQYQITCTGDGDPYLVLEFDTLPNMQKRFNMAVGSDAGVDDEVQNWLAAKDAPEEPEDDEAAVG